LKTREAYNVIVKRIKTKINAVKRSYVSICCGAVFGLILILIMVLVVHYRRDNPQDDFLIVIIFPLIFGILTLSLALKLCSVRRAQMKKDEEVKEVAILRRDAAGPSSALQLPDWLQERQNKRSGGTTFNDSPAYYVRAAACGAVSNTG
jgi:hypothetical protein